MENRIEFFRELHDLLNKYSMEINIGIDGDTHGVDTWISLDHRPDPKSWNTVEILTLDDVTPSTLKIYLD